MWSTVPFASCLLESSKHCKASVEEPIAKMDPLEHSLEIGSEQQVAYSWMIAQESTKETLWTFSNIYSLTKATSSPASLYQTVRLISILIDLWKWLICASVCLRMVAITFSALWKNTMDNMDWLWEITRKEKKTSLPWCHWSNPRPLSHSILSSHLLIFYEAWCSAQMGRHLDVKTLCFMFSSDGKIWASTLSCFARLGKRSWQVGKTFDDFVRSICHRISTAKA